MRVPDAFLKCVGFISHENPTPQYIGTMFVVGIASKSGRVFLHAVTAKHVAESVDGGPFLFGVNFKDGMAGGVRRARRCGGQPPEAHKYGCGPGCVPPARCAREY